MYIDVCDKLHEQHDSQNDKDVQVTFTGACPGNICIVYITMNNRKM